MTLSSPTSPVHVAPIGEVGAIAWLSAAQGGSDLHVVAKVRLHLEGEGYVTLLPPEMPGWHQGHPAPEEVDPLGGRQVLVRGTRAFPGRVVLRRGEATVASVDFNPGMEIAAGPMAGSGKSSAPAERGDWFVVSGGDDARSRRWCKLPALAVVAGWADCDQLPLVYRICAVCTTSWSIALVYRATRFVEAGATPSSISVRLARLDETAAAPPPSVRGQAQPPPSVRNVPAPAQVTEQLDQYARALRQELPFLQRQAQAPESTARPAPAPPIARVATSEDVPAPADLERFSNEETGFADEPSEGGCTKAIDTRALAAQPALPFVPTDAPTSQRGSVLPSPSTFDDDSDLVQTQYLGDKSKG